MGVAIQILEKYLCKVRDGRDCLQFNTVRQLRAAVSDVYSATHTAHNLRYSLKSHRGSVIHMYKGAVQSALVEIFSKGMNRRMTEDSDWNKSVNSLVVNYILNYIKHEWVMPDTESCKKREPLMAAAYICVTYGYYLRGYEEFWVDF